MAIEIVIVDLDLKTVVKHIGSIESDKDFYKLQRIAQYMRLDFIATIYEAGDTIINQLQAHILNAEIQQLRLHPEINQELLNVLQFAITAMQSNNNYYILCVGD